MKQGYTAVLLTFIDLVGCVIMHTSNLLRIHFNFSVCLNNCSSVLKAIGLHFKSENQDIQTGST